MAAATAMSSVAFHMDCMALATMQDRMTPLKYPSLEE
jgi:hypothetical protein